MPAQRSEPAAPPSGFCPYLGIREDPGTCLGYPAEWNLCYRARPAAAASLEQQRTHCLSPVFTRCEVFQSERRAPLPKQLRGARTGKRWKWAVLALLLLLATLGLWVALQRPGFQAFPATGSLQCAAALILAPGAAAFPMPAGEAARSIALEIGAPV